MSEFYDRHIRRKVLKVSCGFSQIKAKRSAVNCRFANCAPGQTDPILLLGFTLQRFTPNNLTEQCPVSLWQVSDRPLHWQRFALPTRSMTMVDVAVVLLCHL